MIAASHARPCEREAPAAAAAPLVVVAFHRFGPYHQARLRAARQALGALGTIEFSAVDDTYAWNRVTAVNRRGHHTLFVDEDSDRKGAHELVERVDRALAELRPQVMVIPGWSDRCALACLRWCERHGVPAVLMSESTAADRPRRWWREWIKRRLVRLCSAALVGGSRHAQYLRQFGMPQAATVIGYDAVDNDYFARQTARVRRSGTLERAQLRLPTRFFLACSRLVEKENLFRLLQAYALYRAGAGARHWRLVILGDGDLRPNIMRWIDGLGVAEDVLLPGFKQYDELPTWYGLAGVFVHASTTEQWGLVVNEAMASGLPVLVSQRCGCAPDLVRDGVNGFTFDPHDVEQLAGLMQRVAAMTDEERHALGRASERIIADWGPERFADGLIRAVQVALRRPPPKASWFDQALLWALAHRP
jgi:1,2-diacylglycerol 3-alpha-glucosyltransferase